ncbi:hypothetical protein A0256_22105 [Mucilaginibacter sp. PAMC 26640]|nr:hypothetical protein A0256_22105 [Mucilaginibacter sp. PAMC 26640]
MKNKTGTGQPIKSFPIRRQCANDSVTSYEAEWYLELFQYIGKILLPRPPKGGVPKNNSNEAKTKSNKYY